MSEERLDGIGVTPLVGEGSVVWYRPDTVGGLPDRPDPDAVEPDVEWSRFQTARETAREDISRERDRLAERIGDNEAAVFDAHINFIDDPHIERGVKAAIENGLPAEHAVIDAFEDYIEQFEGMEGRMAERADDLRDVRNRLVRLLHRSERPNLKTLPEGSVLLAERLTPSDTAKLNPDRVTGFATVAGGSSSHAAIFARSLGLPAVVGIGDDLSAIEKGATVVVDGKAGTVIVDPDEETKGRTRSGYDVEVISEPVSTADGQAIEIAANVGTQAGLDAAASHGADGIGLFRTEFLFLDRETPPDETEQTDVYRAALETFPDERVIVRTLDIGGDKQLPYLDLPPEENPFLGNRGIRRSLGVDADLFETQLRALLRAADSDSVEGLAVMLPFVTTLDEVREARERMESIASSLDAEGVDYCKPEFGVMVETPAASFMADALARMVDFFSIGTNDLTQYVMAAERGNKRVQSLGDHLDPAVLRAIQRTVAGAEGMDCWVGMCGEMAGDPELTELLAGLGLQELSMNSVAIPAVKRKVREIDTEQAQSLTERVLAAESKAEVLDIVGK